MTDNIQLYDQIDRYLRGELKADDAFVQRLQYDKELALEVEVQRLLGEATVDYKLMQVEKIIERHREDALSLNRKSTKWIWQSATAVFIGALVYYYAFVIKKEKTIVKESDPKMESVKKTEIVDALKKSDGQKISQTETRSKETSIKVETLKVVVPKSAAIPEEQQNVASEKHSTIPQALKEVEILSIPTIHSDALEVKKEASVPVPVPCQHVVIKAYVGETKPCNGSRNGLLSVENIRGGTAPYTFSLDKGKNFQEEHVFSHLQASYYDVLVKDAKGCETYVTQQHHLKSKLCVSIAEHSFNPHIETWELPNDIEKAGEISIVSKEGKQVYMRSFGLNEKITWDGSAQNGPLLSSGIYIYTIKYSDGITEQGKITLSY